MNLKKIEIYGFKSFADKVTIEFNDGITAIVGPNGCGKSNVADAIRWVMGEQRMKILRGKKSEDLIFAGTDTRRLLSFCEVSLYFDNSDKIFNLEFNEVVVTRKSYRSSENEYFINNTPCRLKDVQELFRDTGLGREGYSIIGQGMVAQILSSRPDERRLIFEEAAGITNFKAKKETAEKDLEQTNANLAIVDNTISVMEHSLGPLEKQAQATAKAIEYRTELKNLEVNAYLFQTDHNTESKKKVLDKLYALNEELKAENINFEQINEALMQNRLKINSEDDENNAKRDERTQLMLQDANLKSHNRSLADKLQVLTDDVNRLSSERDRNISTIDLKTAELKSAEKKRVQKNAEYTELDKNLAVFTKELEDAEGVVSAMEKKLEQCNKIVMDSKDKRTELVTGKVQSELMKNMLASEIEENSYKSQDLSAKLKSVTAEKKNLQEKIDELAFEKEEKLNEKNDINRKYISNKEILNSAREKKEKLINNRSGLEAKLQLLENFKKSYSGYASPLQALLKDAKAIPELEEKIAGVVGHVLTVPKDLQFAIEIALGGKINNVITKDDSDATELINYLKEHDMGRLTFMPLNTTKPHDLSLEYRDVIDEEGVLGIASQLVRYDKKFKPAVSNVLGSIVIVEDGEVGKRIAKKYNFKFEIVSLDGQFFSTGGNISGGSRAKRDSQILSRDTEINETAEKIKQTAKELISLEEEIIKLKEENETLESKERIADERIRMLELEGAKYSEKQMSVLDEEKRLSAELSAVNKQIDSAKKQVEILTRDLKTSEDAGSELDSAEGEAIALVESLRDEILIKKQYRDQASRREKDTRMAVLVLKNSAENLNETIGRAKNAIAFAEKSVMDSGAEIAVKNAEIKRVSAELEIAVVSETDKNKLNKLNEEIEKIDIRKKALQKERDELELKRDETQKKINALTEKKIRDEGALEKIDSDAYALSEKIREDYLLDYESACELRMEDFDYDKSLKLISKLKGQINALGPVNELAIEEYDKMSVDYIRIKKERDDIMLAITDLQSAISSLTAEMETMFTESFEKISVNFVQIFKDLFGGGKGVLTLVPSPDNPSPLEAGIEIAACPPGKNLKNIMQLSGGESTLTAIAILLSILKLKPMPFCVLDEVEAALDESNADLFAKYIKRFRTTTQFILITHKKPTMENADYLYGITMQEKGVSRVVTVKLSEAVKFVSEE